MTKNKETRAERFKRLAEKRTRRVLGDVRILSNLSNRSLYEYTPEQLRKVFSVIRESLSKAEARFRGEEKKETEFKL